MNTELSKGIKALNKAVRFKKDVFNAFHRNDIGSISLIYGYEGDPTKGFKKGYGIAHIIAKRDWEAKNNPLLLNQKGIDVAQKTDRSNCKW